MVCFRDFLHRVLAISCSPFPIRPPSSPGQLEPLPKRLTRRRRWVRAYFSRRNHAEGWSSIPRHHHSCAWYAWISPWLLDGSFSPVQLILWSGHRLARCVGHNVSFDHARVENEYSLAGTRTRRMDFVSLWTGYSPASRVEEKKRERKGAEGRSSRGYHWSHRTGQGGRRAGKGTGTRGNGGRARTDVSLSVRRIGTASKTKVKMMET